MAARIFFTRDGSPIRRQTDVDRHRLTKAQKKRLKRLRQASRKARPLVIREDEL